MAVGLAMLTLLRGRRITLPWALAGSGLAEARAVLAGDKVLVEMTPYDLTKGRITYRFK